jgi:TonB family protein
MMAGWLTYCLLVSALLGVAAWVAEGAARAQGWPARWAWVAALAGSALLPLHAWVRPLWLTGPPPAPALPLPGAYVMESLPALVAQAPGASGVTVDAVLLGAWATASVVVLGWLAASGLRLRAAGRGWRAGRVDGVEVLVSEVTGPAAVGLFRGRVVLPEWALSLDPALRRLLILHEAEHVRARDPQVAAAGLVLCALMPWNLPLWWQQSRLRLAVELDCDARVLGRSGDAARYGSLLLQVGQRRSGLAVALVESRSMLERRIRMIARTGAGRRTLRALGMTAVAGVVLAVACETPAPTGLADAASRPLGPEQSLAEARSLSCGPVVYLDGDETTSSALQSLDPVGIESVVILSRGGGALEAERVRFERVGDAPDAVPDPACGVILILTRDAPADAAERIRRLREAYTARPGAAAAAAREEDPTGNPTFTPMTVRPQLKNADAVRRSLAANYPPLLRAAGIDGTAEVWLFIDRDGAVRQTRLRQTSGHDALDQAALRVADVMEFTPAYNREERVGVWIVLPITFEVSPG